MISTVGFPGPIGQTGMPGAPGLVELPGPVRVTGYSVSIKQQNVVKYNKCFYARAPSVLVDYLDSWDPKAKKERRRQK